MGRSDIISNKYSNRRMKMRVKIGCYSIPFRQHHRNSMHCLPEPVLDYSVAQRQVKGEDVLFALEDLASIYPGRPGLGKWSVYCVCDGHGGCRAAKFVRHQLGPTLSEVLPLGDPPPFDQPDGEKFAESVRAALVDVFLSLSEAFAMDGGRTSGTTVSVVLVCGWMITTANVGDSEVFLDGRAKIIEMTCCHKVNDNKQEQNRLLAAGLVVKPLSKKNRYGPPRDGEEGVGPLRAWPGGIAMSRSLGDMDCGPHILPMPHIRQIVIPPSGVRMVIASDGLWDHVSGPKACQIIQNVRLPKAADCLMKSAIAGSGGYRLSDDTSIMVLDILPLGQEDFSVVPTQSKFQKRMFLSLVNLMQRTLGKKANSIFTVKGCLYADVDGLVEYKQHLDLSVQQQDANDSNTRIPRRENVATPCSFSQASHSVSGSDAWDVCQASWHCANDAPVVWEFDDRDILDSALNFTSSGSGQITGKKGPEVSLVFGRELGKNISHKAGMLSNGCHGTSLNSSPMGLAASGSAEEAPVARS